MKTSCRSAVGKLALWLLTGCICLIALTGNTFGASGPRAATHPSSVSLPTSNWNMFTFNGDRQNINEQVLSLKTAPDLVPAWSTPPALNSLCSNPAIVNHIAYVADVGNDGYTVYVNAYNATTGQLIWSTLAPNLLTCTSPAVSNGVVYVSSNGIDAFDATTGKLLWSRKGRYTSAPAIADGILYVGGSTLSAFDTSTGNLLWSAPVGDGSDSIAPTVSGESVYLAGKDGKLYAFNAATGSKRWATPFFSPGYNGPAASVANGLVYIGAPDGSGIFYAMDASTGAIRWTFTTGGSILSTPAIADGIVYFTSRDNYLYALNATTGVLLWLGSTGSTYDNSPAIANGVLYNTFMNGVEALNARNGRLLWIYCTSCQNAGSVGSSPAIANGMVYLQTSFFYIMAFGLPQNAPSLGEFAIKLLRERLAPISTVFSLSLAFDLGKANLL